MTTEDSAAPADETDVRNDADDAPKPFAQAPQEEEAATWLF